MRLSWMGDLGADLHYTQRTLRRSPAFLMTAVLSLALGIGANTAIFQALDAVLWKPLPVADPQSLVRFSISRMNRVGAPGISEKSTRGRTICAFTI